MSMSVMRQMCYTRSTGERVKICMLWVQNKITEIPEVRFGGLDFKYGMLWVQYEVP